LLFAHQQIPLGVPQEKYKLSWSVQKQRQLSLHGTNITPIQNGKMQPALYSAKFNYTPLVIRRTDKSMQLTIVSQCKLALTAINKLFVL
jgi:hypothetical protein